MSAYRLRSITRNAVCPTNNTCNARIHFPEQQGSLVQPEGKGLPEGYAKEGLIVT